MSITDVIDLQEFRVIYKGQFFNAVSILEIYFQPKTHHLKKGLNELDYIIILVIDTNGNLKTIHDNVFEFKFIPKGSEQNAR